MYQGYHGHGKKKVRVESENFRLFREIRKGLEKSEESGNLRISGHGSLHKTHLFCSWGWGRDEISNGPDTSPSSMGLAATLNGKNLLLWGANSFKSNKFFHLRVISIFE